MISISLVRKCKEIKHQRLLKLGRGNNPILLNCLFTFRQHCVLLVVVQSWPPLRIRRISACAW